MRTTKLGRPAGWAYASILIVGLGAAGAAACSATSNNQFGDTSGSGASSGNGGQGGDINFTSGTGNNTGGNDTILTQAPPCDGVDPNIDNDGDGWTGAAGDCNDCTGQMNPGALDWPGNGVDEDCNGTPDDNPINCDGPLDIQSGNAFDGAKAMGLCKMQQGQSWGLVDAKYVTADGQPLENFDFEGLGHGILPNFGPNVNPQEGAKLLAISSGTARRPGDPGYEDVAGYDKDYTTGAPSGFPKESPACPDVMTGAPHDSAGLLLQIKAPSNAKSLHFNLNFYTYEFPQYVCDIYNDFFVAILNPPPTMYPDGNISFDEKGNLISVNAGFLQVCHPQFAGNMNYPCPLGPAQLMGTGFDEDPTGFLYPDNSAATGWLQTTAPIEPGAQFSLLLTAWDSGDGALDSTVLLDNFGFDVKDLGTVTAPIDVPK